MAPRPRSPAVLWSALATVLPLQLIIRKCLSLDVCADVFYNNGVTGDVLDVLVPSVLPSSFGIHDPLHQRSILAGIRFLKQCGFDVWGTVKQMRNVTDVGHKTACSR